MRKRKRQMMAGIVDAIKHGKLSEVQGTMCKDKPVARKAKGEPRLLNDKVGGKQKCKGSSKARSVYRKRHLTECLAQVRHWIK